MDTVIKIENLSKKYVIRHQKHRSYTTLREMITESAEKMGGKLFSPFSSNHKSAPTQEEFWALKDVSFEVKRGERIGIIGRNGAGKTTLLKILSRITEPTAGRVKIKGRVASLLEVGTGFHPELTGRENIFLNGAILGMIRSEIKKKFDEIVAFAEIEKFLDTPVKRYSSGMYVRLAFAVAAHLDPEILIVDEVLSVGDAAFQKKCLGKMGEVGEEGRTVLFVSHNMGAVSSMCSRAILLAKGGVVTEGSTDNVIAKYMDAVGARNPFFEGKKKPDRVAWIESVCLVNREGQKTDTFSMAEDLIIEYRISIKEESLLTLGVQINELNGSSVYFCPNTDTPYRLPSLSGVYKVRVRFSPLMLVPGRYEIWSVFINHNHIKEREDIYLGFEMIQDYSLVSRAWDRKGGLIYRMAEFSGEIITAYEME